MTACRACGSDTEEAFSLGHQVPANRFLAEADFDKPEPSYDLTVMLCLGCGLSQLRTLVPATDLFSKYLFRTSNAPSLRKHFAELAEAYGGPSRSIVEVGSNDGALLRYLKDTGSEVTGVDPAANLAAIAQAEGVPTIVGFFGSGAERECPKADVVLARNVFAHVPDQIAFLKAVGSILKPGGVFVVEAPWVAAMFKEGEAGQIYHEHGVYLGIASFRAMLEPLGFYIANAKSIDLYGGSLQYEVRRGRGSPTMETVALEAIEWRRGCYNLEGWKSFGRAALILRDRFKRDLEERRGNIAGYCASAKGSVLLQWAGVGIDLMPFCVDTTAIKQGLYVPRTRIPIVAPSMLREWEGEWLAVMSANWFDGIRKDPTLSRFKMVSTDGRIG